MPRTQNSETPTSSSFLKDHYPLFGLTAILAVGLALRLPNLLESLWYDELWSTAVVLRSLPVLLHRVFHDIHPPLYNAFMFLWINLFGDSELTIRLPSMVFGLGGIVLTYLLARHFFGQKAGLLAAALVAFSPTHIWYSQEATCYSMLMFLLLLAVYSFQKYDQERQRSAWFWAYTVSIFAAIFTHYYVMAFAVFITLLCLRRSGPNPRNWRVIKVNLLAMACLGCLVAAKIIAGVMKTGAGYLREFDWFELWMLLFNWFPTGNAIWPMNMWASDFSILPGQPLMLVMHLFLLCVLLIGIADSLIRARPDAPDSRYFVGYLICLPALLFALVFLGFNSSFVEQSGFAVMPFFFALLANGVFAFRIRTIRVAATTVLGVICVASLFAFYTKGDQWTVYKPNPDWRAAAGFLAAEIDNSPGEPVILAKTPANVLTYYDHRFHERGANPAGQAYQYTKFAIEYLGNEIPANDPALAFPEPPDAVYLIHNSFWSFNLDEVRKDLEQRLKMKPAGVKEFKGLRIFKYTKEQAAG